MLIYQEAAIADIKIGDLIEVEMNGVHIGAKVIGRDLEQGTLSVVPYSYAIPSGSGFVMSPRPPAMEPGVLTVRPGNGVRVLKAVDSEAAVTEPLTWERIAELEPGVLVLLEEIKAERPREYNDLLIWRNYKQRLCELVGWDREATSYPELRSSCAYNIVYDKLLNSLRDPE